jgi:molecular chaperone DnaK
MMKAAPGRAPQRQPSHGTQLPDIVGIDLGTTNSYVAVLAAGEPQVILDREGRKATPSVVAAPEGGPLLVGHAARGFALTSNERWISGPKRLLGRRYDSEPMRSVARRFPVTLKRSHGDAILVHLGDGVFSPEQVSGLILYQLCEVAREYLDAPVTSAMVAVPCTYGAEQRDLVNKAAQAAGLTQVQLVDEPTAALLAHKCGPGASSGTRAVFHLGGGTCEVSLVTVGSVATEVIATAQDAFLGGVDFDAQIVQVLLAEASQQDRRRLVADVVSRQRLFEAAELAKIALSSAEQTTIDLPHLVDGDPPVHLRALVDRAQLEQITAGLIDRALGLCRAAMTQARIDRDQIDGLVLEGGQTRMPRVRDAVAELFGRAPVAGPEPEECVARGAVLAGTTAAGEEELVLAHDPYLR